MKKTPNILMILVDQMRYDCVGYSDDYPVQTPHIDKLAAEGMWFTNAYTHIPLCCPARQSLVNGRRPESFGALWNFGNSLKVGALEPSEYAWPRDLKKLDYNSGYLGKWAVHPDHSPLEYGYDRYVPDEGYQQFKAEHYPDVKYTQAFMGEADPIPLEDARTHWLARQADELIRESAATDRPWHIRLNFTEPHLPCRPAGRFAEMYSPEDVPKWRSFDDTFENKPYIQKQQLLNWQIDQYTWEDWAPIVARYYGVISQVDEAIGRVLSTLAQLELEDNTIVIFTTDHGDMCGGHRMMDKHYILYDDVVKVPFIVKWPGRILPGQSCDQFVYNLLDMPPTILDMLDLDIPDFFHGQSLVPLLQGESIVDWRTEVVATYNGQQFGLYTQRMIRNIRWKYIWNTTDVDELYDLAEDPNELHNLIHHPEHADIVKQLREKLYKQLKQDGDDLVNNEWMKGQLLLGHKL